MSLLHIQILNVRSHATLQVTMFGLPISSTLQDIRSPHMQHECQNPWWFYGNCSGVPGGRACNRTNGSFFGYPPISSRQPHAAHETTDVAKFTQLASDKQNALVNLADELEQKVVNKQFLLGVWLRIVDDEDGGTSQPMRHVFWAAPADAVP